MADATTFDLLEALAGRSYPEEIVEVYLDEGVAHEIEIADEALRVLSGKGDYDSYQSLEEKRNALAQKMKSSRVAFTIRGTSREDKIAMNEAFVERCRDEKKLPENKRGEEFAVMTWCEHVVGIRSPRDEPIEVSEDVIRKFRLQAPDASVARIEKAIKRINTVSEGFDIAVNSPDF